ncbi:uncharacterized protein LOC123551682 [Mercenaria mercenaria]|uniref:uncharacterized protein LOC123551682 n=1 Tax=Mercenaria mercenaria TaxID=6596 RepID=UPI00234E84D0|nr:uncharacterized protein LOC123551682 [Mercenaria mercenaria]
MGVDASKNADVSLDWTFVGRGNDMKKVKQLLQEYKTIGIYGMWKIGKSSFLVELYKDMKESGSVCLMKDFETEDITSSFIHYKWLNDLLSYTDMHSEYTDFKNKCPCEDSLCGKCKHCNHNISCDNKKDRLVQKINETIASLKLCSKQIILFFDNLDKLIKSDLKDCLLYFIHELNEKCPKIKLVFCSSNKAHCCHKSYGRFVLGALEERSILDLIYLTTESSDDASTSEYGRDMTQNEAVQNKNENIKAVENLFKQENKYFTPENKVYIEKIATLCEGHPLAAIESGSLLTEDEGILTPEELMEILTEARLEVLGSDHCLPEDRLDICDTPLQKVKYVYRVLFNEKRIASEGIIDDSSVF